MKLANWLAMAALALAVLGILLFVEVIRPFHDLSIDGPLALLSWGAGQGWRWLLCGCEGDRLYLVP